MTSHTLPSGLVSRYTWWQETRAEVLALDTHALLAYPRVVAIECSDGQRWSAQYGLELV